MYRRVLVAYDGSPPADAALDAALELMSGQPTEFEIALVLFDLPLSVEISDGTLLAASRQAQRTAGGQVLLRARERAARADMTAHCTLLDAEGRRIAEVLVEHAAREHVGLIVIGSHGRRGASRALLGSDAELVARLSPMPVMIVREAARPA